MSATSALLLVTILSAFTTETAAIPFSLSKRKGGGGRGFHGGAVGGGGGTGSSGDLNKNQKLVLIVSGSIIAALILLYIIIAHIMPWCQNRQRKRKNRLQLRIDPTAVEKDSQRLLITSRAGTPRPYSPGCSLYSSPAVTPRILEDWRSTEADGRFWHPDISMPDPVMLSVNGNYRM